MPRSPEQYIGELEQPEEAPRKRETFLDRLGRSSPFRRAALVLSLLTAGSAIEAQKPKEAEAKTTLSQISQTAEDIIVREAAEEILDKKTERETLSETEVVNEDIDLQGLNRDSAPLIEDKDIEISGGQIFNNRQDLQRYSRDSLNKIFTKAGIKNAVSRQRLDEETKQRQRERENPEVQPGPGGNVPEQGTIIRETHEIVPHIYVINSEKDLRVLLDLFGGLSRIKGLDLEVEKSTLVVALDIINRETQNSSTIFAIGKENDFSKIRGGILGGIVVDLERRDDRGRELRALSVAFENLGEILEQKLDLAEKFGQMEGEILGIHDDIVTINIGENNGVKPGMRFKVEMILIDKVGDREERTPVPTNWEIEVLQVDENSASCKIVGEDKFELHPGFRVLPVETEEKNTNKES